jgi:hypothetical protein
MELLRYRHKTNSRQLNIRPFGDLQMGEAGFRKDLWNKWKREALEDTSALFIGMGDYTDRFRTTVDKKLVASLSDDSSAWSEFDELMMKEMQELAAELKPLKDRIIGLHCGHHHHRLMNASCTCQYLCQLLGVRHLGFVAMIQLVFDRKNRNTHEIDIFSTHGCGGSSKPSGDISQVENKIVPFWDADLYLRGHSTKAWVSESLPLNYLSWDRNNGILTLKKKRRLMVNTGGFMEGYTEGRQSYVERSNMPPCALGWSVVNIHIPCRGEEPIKINANAYTE